MICIYEKTTSDFNNNGLGTLEPIECTFKPIINGVWSLEMTLPYDADGKSQLIANDRILKVTDIDCVSEQTSDYQLFRIYDFKKEDNFVSVIAYPIGLDARFDTFVDSVKMNYKNASQAISQMNSLSSKYTVSGSGYSSAVKSAEYANANLISILNGDNSFVQVWDGEICYDNYNIRVNHRLGSSSNPLDVRYGKNIIGMSYDTDASNIITQLYPKSKDGYPLDIEGAYVNRNYVNASNFADYPIPHMYYVQAPFNLVQLSNDGSEEYLLSTNAFNDIKETTMYWLKKALLEDETYGGLLTEIELDWINNNYDLTTINDGVQGIVEYLWQKLVSSSHANITHDAVKSLIYNAIKAGFKDVLKNSESSYYVGSASKKLMQGGSSEYFYTYTWDASGLYRDRAEEGYIWVYANSKWNQIDTSGLTTGATDKTKWKWYKVKGKTYKRYGNKKKNRYLHQQWWKINDVWYWFNDSGKSNKGDALASMYYSYFEDAEIATELGENGTFYSTLTATCQTWEQRLVGLLNNQMEQYCLNLFENEKLSYPTEKLGINMVDLSQTTEYKDFQSLERIHLGDSVKVYNPRLGIESTVRVIGLTYDVLRKMNTEIQIGVTETSVINLLNNIGKGSDEVRYVAGDGITIENNTISIVPTKPYLEDVILNGESVVRNHKAYIDLDELGIDESIDVLYGEEEPDDEDDGEDKDFYLKLGIETANILTLDKFHNENSTEQNPIYLTDFIATSRDEYNFVIHGCPDNKGHGEWCYFELDGLVEGNTYELSFKMKFNDGASFPWRYTDYVETCGTRIEFKKNSLLNEYSCTFTYVADGQMFFNFPAINDNVMFTATITDMKIAGDFVSNNIDEIYNKYEDKWRKYKRVKDVTKNGESVVNEQGVAEIPESASSVSDLTDVELTDLADGEILKYDATAQKWLNAVESGGGGGAGGSSVYSEKQLYKASEDSFQNISVTWDWEEYDAYIFNAHGTCSTTSYKQNGDSTILTKAQIKNLIDMDLTQYFYRGANQTIYKFSANAMTATNNSGGYFVTEIIGLKFGTLSPIIYSEEEREVGVWIDNKPLYCKTIDIGQLPNNSAKSINLDSTIELIVNYSGVIYGNKGGDDIKWNRPLPFTDNTITNITRVSNDNNVLKITTKADWRGYNAYLTIWYTKTTDVAGSGSYNTLGVPTVHYSTDEQVIGTFLGKPLYQKIFDWSSSPVNIPSTWLETTIDSSNIQRVIECKGHHADGTFYTTDADPTGNSHTKLKIRNNGGDGTYSYVTLQYTKIND